MVNVSEIEKLAIKLWQEETGKTSLVGWGDDPKTYEFRSIARKKLEKSG